MSNPRSTLCALLVICAGAVSVIRAEEPQLLPQSGILVLRTGRVLRGDIVRVGDRYVVTSGEKDEVGVSLDAVEMQCDSLEDAYRRKQDQMPPNRKVADHLKLADWCLQYDLFASAAEQLMAAQLCDPNDPANETFEKRLRLAVQRPASISNGTESVAKIISPPDLDESLRSLPAGTMELFTNTIQPLLINRCGASNCHGPNSSSSFRLAYPNWSRTLPRRFTQRNLQAAMSFLDRDEPLRSPMLVMSTLRHGKMSKPALTDEDVTQLQNLAEWVYHSLGSASPASPAELSSPESLLLQPGASRLDPQAAANRHTAGPVAPDTTGPSERLDRAVEPASHSAPAEPGTGAAPVAGVDPFDPEIFNRRFGSGKKPR